MTDLKSKLTRLLADCDLVILPRLTLLGVNPPMIPAPYEFHALDPAQVDAIKEYMGKGKPVLACFGSVSVPFETMMRMRRQPKTGDGIDDLFGQLDIKLGRQTILHRAEIQELAAAQTFGVSGGADIPSVRFDWKSVPLLQGDAADPTPNKLDPNPLRESLRLAARSIGKELDLKLAWGRPVFFTASDRSKLPYEPEFMLTDNRTWSEDRPFPNENPKLVPPKDARLRGTLENGGNGPFTLGIALEVEVPAAWRASKDAAPEKCRVAVLGHGSVFAGEELKNNPAKEKLLMDTCNYLLRRDDLLAYEEYPDPNRGLWKFPRLEDFSDRQKSFWHLATQVILPGFFVYLGLVVLMVRQLR